MTISREQFIETQRRYLEANEARFSKSRNEQPKGGFLRSITSLFSNNNTAKPEPDIPYIQTRSTLTLDVRHLYFLILVFQQLGLEDTQLSPLPVHDLSKGLQADMTYIHRFFANNIHSLKLHQEQTRIIQGYDQLPDTPLPLTCFKSLTCLELYNIDLNHISLPDQQLTNLIIRHTDPTPIFSTTWPHLKYLMLQDTNLTTLDDMQHLASITHFNASKNLLINVPSGLAALYNLTSLNLSYNMIEDTNTVLGNIHELNLRGNRLTSLIGLHRLWALERLDVRDNQIKDVAEITRLNELPNISHLWVEGNPFTKIQTGYKDEIFGAFDTDITLDNEKPKGRRIQMNNTPTTSAIIADEQVIIRAKTINNKRQVRLGQLKQPDLPVIIDDNDDDSHKYRHRLSLVEESVQQEHAQLRKAASLKSRRSSKSERKKRSTQEKKQDNHAFRKKIEAMRREAGTEWLRVLQEMDDVVKK